MIVFPREVHNQAYGSYYKLLVCLGKLVDKVSSYVDDVDDDERFRKHFQEVNGMVFALFDEHNEVYDDYEREQEKNKKEQRYTVKDTEQEVEIRFDHYGQPVYKN